MMKPHTGPSPLYLPFPEEMEEAKVAFQRRSEEQIYYGPERKSADPSKTKDVERREHEEESKKQCEEIISQFLQALNGQQFDITTWSRIAPNVRVAWGILYLQKDGNKTLSLHEWLPAVRLFAKDSPNFHFHISNLTTMVDEKAGTAESLLNVELSGVFQGIVRQSVAGFGFVRKDGMWEAVRHGAFAGSAIL